METFILNAERLTPGVYDVAKSISVKRPDTVVLGMGLATLDAVDGAIPLMIVDKPGIIVASVTIDAGAVESPVLLRVGKKNGNNGVPNTDPSNPVALPTVIAADIHLADPSPIGLSEPQGACHGGSCP